MTRIKTRISIAPDGVFTGQTSGLPAGEHEAEIVLLDAATRPAQLNFDDLLARVRAIQAEIARLHLFDNRSPDAIIGYNERGHFN